MLENRDRPERERERERDRERQRETEREEGGSLGHRERWLSRLQVGLQDLPPDEPVRLQLKDGVDEEVERPADADAVLLEVRVQRRGRAGGG